MRRTWKLCAGGLYEASSLGEIRRASSKRQLSLSCDGHGYLKTTLTLAGGVETTRTVHSLVAEAFLGPRPGRAVVNHIDGVKWNNLPSNLEYCSYAENSAHAKRLGLVPKGERSGRHTKPWATARGERVNTAVLDVERVRQMRQMRSEGATLTELMAVFGLSKSATHQVVTRKSWRHVA